MRLRPGKRQLTREWKRFATPGRAVHEVLTPEEEAEERRLWADYYEAVERVLEIMRRDGTADAARSRIVAEDTAASRAIARIKELHGIPWVAAPVNPSWVIPVLLIERPVPGKL